MKFQGALARCLAGMLATLVVAGCATSGPRNRYLRQIAPGSVTDLTAYRAGNTLEIIYPVGGKEAFAHASWSPLTSGPGEYNCQFAVLTFGKENHATRRSVVQPGNHFIIRDAKQWQQLLQAVVAGLAPKQPGHGILLLVQYLEIVVFRDTAGALKVVKLGNKPSDISVDRTFSDEDFSREAIQLLASKLSASDSNQCQFLFLTGKSPAFVLVDLQDRRLVFLSYPTDPETEPVTVPGWFTLRALNSLLIKSAAITAIKNPFTLVSRGLWHLGNSGMTMLGRGPGIQAARHPRSIRDQA